MTHSRACTQSLERLCTENGVTCILVHHLNKTGSDQANSVRLNQPLKAEWLSGNSAIMSVPQNIVMVAPYTVANTRGNGDFRRVSC